MWRARYEDALRIWGSGAGPWHRPPVVLKLKASFCIFMGWEAPRFSLGDYDSFIPIWVSDQSARWTWDGPECVWQEVAVRKEWWRWQYARYENGF